MRKNLFILLLSSVIILATILFFVSTNNKVNASNYLEIIKNAPDMLDLTKNKEVKLKDYIGKYMVLEVWETWCPACKKSIPELIKFNQEYPKLNKLKDNVVFLSFLSDSSGSKRCV